MNDFRVTYHGSINLVQLLTPAAKQWVAENVSDDAQFFGGALVVEPRYTGDLRDGMLLAGLQEAA